MRKILKYALLFLLICLEVFTGIAGDTLGVIVGMGASSGGYDEVFYMYITEVVSQCLVTFLVAYFIFRLRSVKIWLFSFILVVCLALYLYDYNFSFMFLDERELFRLFGPRYIWIHHFLYLQIVYTTFHEVCSFLIQSFKTSHDR